MKEMRQEFSDMLLEVGMSDPNLVVLVGDISHFRLIPFAQACPGRYYNVGICEQTIVNMAAGLAMTGFFPVVHTIAPFLVERAYEQIKLDLCYQKIGANILTVGSAFDYSTLGCTHHCYTDFALLKPLPDIEILFPASSIELNTLFKQTYNNGKVTYIRIPKCSHEHAFEPKELKVGKGIKVKKGKDITIVVVGPQLKTAMKAAEQLEKEGLSIEIIYLHTIKPFDKDIVVNSIRKTGKVLTIEEHSMFGGVGDEVLRSARDISSVKYATIALADDFIRKYGSYEELCEMLGFSVKGIVTKIKNELIGGCI